MITNAVICAPVNANPPPPPPLALPPALLLPLPLPPLPEPPEPPPLEFPPDWLAGLEAPEFALFPDWFALVSPFEADGCDAGSFFDGFSGFDEEAPAAGAGLGLFFEPASSEDAGGWESASF